MPSPFSASLSDTIATSSSVVEVVNPWTSVFTTVFGSGQDTSQYASRSDTIASSDVITPVSGVTGYVATLSDTVHTRPGGYSSGFSLGFGSSLTQVEYTAVFGAAQTTSDTVATSSSVFISGNALVLPTETASTSDTLVSVASAFSSTLGDTVTTSAGPSTTVTRSLIDSLTATDSLTAAPSAILAMVDNAVTSERYSLGSGLFSTQFARIFDRIQPVALSFTISDTVATSDIISPSAKLSLSDSVATSESLSGVLGAAAQTLSDSLSTSDSRSGTAAITGSLNEIAATSDALAQSGTGLPLADTDAIVDSLAGAGKATATLSTDTINGSDILLLSATAQSLIDSVSTSDTLGKTSGYASALSDTAATSDSLTPAAVAPTATLSNTTATSETLTGVFAIVPVTLSDSAATSDTLSSAGHGLPLSDSVNSSDTLTPAAVGPTTRSDSAATGESLTFLRGYVNSPSDTVATSETLTPVPLISPISLSDSVATSETLTPATGARTATLSDAGSLAEQLNLVTYLASIGDAVGNSDALIPAGATSAALADSATTSDAIQTLTFSERAVTSETLTGQGAGFQAFTDAALSGDILLPVRGFVTAIADNVATSETLTQTNFGYSFVLADTPALTETWINVGVGSPLTMTAMVIPTGGAVLLEFPGYFPVLPRATELTISRSIDGSGVWTVIYDGPPVGVFLDVGDGSPKPLDPTTAYLWQAEDYSGTAVVGPLTPASTFINLPDQLTQILIRALQGAINSMTLPTGIQRPQITIKMPQNGWQAMPFIVVNVDLIQQTEVAMGESVINPTPDNNWTLFANAKRVWRVTIMSQDAEERDFYRDTLLAVFRVLKATAFGPIGLDVSHTFQAVSYSSAQEWEGVTPGFYAADLMLEINGVFPAAVLTNYPVILQIESTPTWQLNTFNETIGPSGTLYP